MMVNNCGYEEEEEGGGDYAIGKIVFSDRFYGREFELDQLHEAYARLTSATDDSNHGAAEMVLVGGYAGTGKSRLVRAFQEDLNSKVLEGTARPCYFLSGKADELSSTEPCSPLVDAISQWCSLLLESSSQQELVELRTTIMHSIGDEGKVLTDLVPSLEQLIGKQPDLIPLATESNANALNRLKYIFARFITALATEERPLVLFIDDLHWLDPASLSLLDYLITSPTLKHFMLIGAYRDNDVDNEHALTKCLNNIRRNGKTFIMLSLGNLPFDDTTRMMADTLHLETEHVESLSKVVFEKTQGNIFFVRNALQMLERKEVVKYSFADMKWTWGVKKVNSAMDISENVVSLVVGKLQSLPNDLQHILAITAFLPATFHVETLRALLVARSFPVTATDGVVELLDAAVSEGLLENTKGSPKYRFAHDRIQQAAKMLVQGEERFLLRLEVARQLLASSSQPGGADSMFVAVDHLNAVPVGFVQTSMGIKRLAELNYEVGVKAARVSAFAIASSYFRKGVELVKIDENRWKLHYKLCLDLYNATAEIEICIGSFNEAKQLIDEVLEHATCFDDKLRAYQALSEGLGQRQRHSEALASDKNVLKILGEAPRFTNFVSALLQLSGMKRTLSKWTDEEILALPIVTDKKTVAVMKTLSIMAMRSYQCSMKFVALGLAMRQLRMILGHGLTAVSAFTFAAYSSMLYTALGDEDFGQRIANLSVKIARVTKAKAYEARIVFILGNYIHSWNHPLSKVMDMFDRGYKAGMAVGDIEFACLCHLFHSIHGFLAGWPLDGIVKDCLILRGLLQQYSLDFVSSVLFRFEDFLQAMTGQMLEPLDRWKKGGIAAFKRSSERSRSMTFSYLFLYLFSLQLAWYLGDSALAYRLFLEFEKYKDAEHSFFCISEGLFFSVLVCTSLFRKTGKWKFRRRSQRSLDTMKSLTRRKGLNILHKYLIVEAECASTFSGNKNCETKIKEKFDKAIAVSTRAGFLQDAAIANELAGENSIRQGDTFWAKHYLTAAYGAYVAWGAQTKVKQLLDHRGSFIETDTCMSSRTSFRRKSTDAMTMQAFNIYNTLDLSREESEPQLLGPSADMADPTMSSASLSPASDVLASGMRR